MARLDTPTEVAAAKVAAKVAETAAITAATAADLASRVADKLTGQSAQTAIIATDISYIKNEISDIKQRLDSKYVTQDSFEPVKRIVYGLVAVLGLATLGAIAKLIFK